MKSEFYKQMTKDGKEVTINTTTDQMLINGQIADFYEYHWKAFLRISLTNNSDVKVVCEFKGMPKDSSSLINDWSTLSEFVNWYYKRPDSEQFTVFAPNRSTVILRKNIYSFEYGYEDREESIKNVRWYKFCKQFKTILTSDKYLKYKGSK